MAQKLVLRTEYGHFFSAQELGEDLLMTTFTLAKKKKKSIGLTAVSSIFMSIPNFKWNL